MPDGSSVAACALIRTSRQTQAIMCGPYDMAALSRDHLDCNPVTEKKLAAHSSGTRIQPHIAGPTFLFPFPCHARNNIASWFPATPVIGSQEPEVSMHGSNLRLAQIGV